MRLRRLYELLYVLFGEGSWSFLPHEEQILMAAIESLPNNIRSRLEAQLKHDFFVERTNARINVLRFYETLDNLRVAGAEFDDKWIRVKIRLDGKLQTANVNIYKGLLFSVETKSPKIDFRNKTIDIVSVERGSLDATYTSEIDEAAHPEE